MNLLLFMALVAKIVTFNIGLGAATTTVPVTGVGFTPTALILWWSGRTESVDTIGRDHIKSGIGFVTGTANRLCSTVTSENAVATSDSYRAMYNDACIAAITVAGAVDGLADLQSLDSDGFTLVIDSQFATNLRICALCIGGTANALAIDFATNTVTGNQDITSIGFQGDVVLFAASRSIAAFGTIEAVSYQGIGAAVSSSQRFTIANVADDASATSDTYSYAKSTECLTLLSASSTATRFRADFVSWLSNGFTINILEHSDANAMKVICLVLKGGSWIVGNLLTQTNTVTDIVESGFGFAPIGGLFASHTKAENTTVSVPHAELSMGAFDSISSRAVQDSLDRDAVTTMECTTAIEFDEVYANISTASTIDGLMDIKSKDSGGFTCIMDDADPLQSFVGYIAFGNIISPASWHPPIEKPYPPKLEVVDYYSH